MINLYSKTNKNNQVNTSKIYDVKGKIPTVELAGCVLDGMGNQETSIRQQSDKFPTRPRLPTFSVFSLGK